MESKDSKDAKGAAPNLKQREEVDRDRVRKRERKALVKSLQLAQISTASMGKFDKKVNKYEPAAPSIKGKPTKRSNASLDKV
jgi:hypothetical protein